MGGPLILRVFPRRTSQTPRDPLSFVGDPPLFCPDADEVHVSCVFTWDRPEAVRLRAAWSAHYPCVKVGGPAFGDPGAAFTPGRYVSTGVTFTSRGCPNLCPLCTVPQREGPLRELPISPGWIVQDNNLTACSQQHLDSVFQMLREQPLPIQFAGGLDARRINSTWVDRLRSIRLGQVFIAYDRPGDEKATRRAASVLRRVLTRKKCRCFVLIGYPGDTLDAARHRCEQAWEWGLLPFAMLYRDDKGARPSNGWPQLQRTFCRPALTARHFSP